MDAQAKKKALFRAKLNAQKKEKRINSPLVRYNESDQPVCRVCDVVLKSESQWDAHQASRKHHEAVSNLKASATGLNRGSNVIPEPPRDAAPRNARIVEKSVELQTEELEPLTKSAKALASSVLPSDFFDNPEAIQQKAGLKRAHPDSFRNAGDAAGSQPARELSEKPTQTAGSESKQIKGALPEGFFDNKEADLRARGIKPVKLDVKDEYKEFEKLIQEDLQEVDERMEEEEIDAAEMIEEHETLEQKIYREKVEMLKKKRMEIEAARLTKRSRNSPIAQNNSTHEDSSSDDDDDVNFAVDWRAQHL